MTQLQPMTPFPSVAAKDLDGNDVDLADVLGGQWTAVLLYRGHW